MNDNNMAKTFATILGVVLIVVGLIGFIPNPIAYAENAIFPVNAIHNIVHLLTGAAALGIAFGISGREQQGNALIAFGVVYALVLVLTLVDPELFGLFADAPANVADHALHAVLAIASIAVGYMARSERSTVAAAR
jgi:hypothetical protein